MITFDMILATGGDWMDVYLKDIGARIRLARMNKHMTQAQLASAVNMTTTYINRLENGKTSMSISVLIAISDTLEVSTDWLLRNNTDTALTITADEISEELKTCTPREREAILQIVQTITGTFQQLKIEKDD